MRKDISMEANFVGRERARRNKESLDVMADYSLESQRSLGGLSEAPKKQEQILYQEQI